MNGFRLKVARLGNTNAGIDMYMRIVFATNTQEGDRGNEIEKRNGKQEQGNKTGKQVVA